MLSRLWQCFNNELNNQYKFRYTASQRQWLVEYHSALYEAKPTIRVVWRPLTFHQTYQYHS